MSAMTKKEWMEYLEKTWDAAQKEAWSEPEFECPRCGHCCQTKLETEQEPVAWISDSPTKGNGKQLHWTKSEAWRWSSNITPLYTSPPKREWVGLTADEIWQCNKASGSAVEFHICYEHQNVLDFAESLEAKLREKNT